jgi:hypothetical protein
MHRLIDLGDPYSHSRVYSAWVERVVRLAFTSARGCDGATLVAARLSFR